MKNDFKYPLTKEEESHVRVEYELSKERTITDDMKVGTVHVYLFDEEIYLKYPGFSASLDEMVTMPKIKNKILLHGIVPSSGSIFDEHLCDNMDEWVKLFKEHNNRWVSLHFYYNSKICCDKDIDKVCKNNIKKLEKNYLKYQLL